MGAVRKWLAQLASVPGRIRASRGFGIHSPFAYSFVTDVLFSPNGYYAYAEIGPDDHARRLYRVLVALAPATIVKSGPLSQAQTAACTLAAQGTSGHAQCPKAVIVSPDSVVGFSYLRRVLGDGGCAVFTDIRNERSRELMEEIRGDAMVFEGLRLVVAVGFRHLPHQTFRLMM